MRTKSISIGKRHVIEGNDCYALFLFGLHFYFAVRVLYYNYNKVSV